FSESASARPSPQPSAQSIRCAAPTAAEPACAGSAGSMPTVCATACVGSRPSWTAHELRYSPQILATITLTDKSVPPVEPRILLLDATPKPRRCGCIVPTSPSDSDAQASEQPSRRWPATGLIEINAPKCRPP